MTDAEINLAIAQIEFTGKELCPCEDHIDVRLGNGDYTTVDYVNDSDIGQIIEREKITVGYNNAGSLYFAHDRYGNAIAYSDTPNKAAALTFLKMKGVEI